MATPKLLTILCLIGLYSVPLAASEPFDWKPTTAAAVGLLWDTTSTIRFTSNGSGCQEKWEKWGYYRRPDGSFNAPKALLTDAATIGGLALASRLTSRWAWPRRILRTVAYAQGGVGVINAARNIHNCGW